MKIKKRLKISLQDLSKKQFLCSRITSCSSYMDEQRQLCSKSKFSESSFFNKLGSNFIMFLLRKLKITKKNSDAWNSNHVIFYCKIFSDFLISWCKFFIKNLHKS